MVNAILRALFGSAPTAKASGTFMAGASAATPDVATPSRSKARAGINSRRGRRPFVTVIGLRGIPDVSGGIETHCEYLYPRVADQNRTRDFLVIGRKPSMGDLRHRLRPNLSVLPLPAMSNRFMETISNTFLAILDARFRQGSRIVHIHAVGPALLAPLARALGMKVVMTHHGDDYRRAKWNGFVKGILKTGERVGIGSAHQVIAVSRSLAERLKREYPQKAGVIHYVPNGADHILDEARSSKRSAEDWVARFGLSGTPFMVSVGRLVPEKGFADLIRAYAIARPAARLVIVGGQSGSAHDAEIANLIAEKGLQDHVILTGAIPREGVAALLSRANLFVLASHHEGLPIAALEAAAMSTPILVSDIQPNLDLGLSSEHYFPVGDHEALARILRNSWDSTPEADVLSDFNWARIATQTGRIYDSLGFEAS
ncbi:glycosyltransferase involved in cell wall biosynthesis [Aliiruegeria haliotis]|uniref:Glycosyltransferase involved in cell wall biosynthesis n=1 Tax=Aliiruegeria haliotis TaxID=1280846 RepID=A0A2T0S067_9RHOB|nr:glycosyltransferase family 4 protein [Aliiruegeria haliotis]PRY26831.1 glycosyltransferase involved in cell wall biosynthesis [Aliiruegeria haliotis]